MNKNDIINEVVSSLVFSLDPDKLELVKKRRLLVRKRKKIQNLSYDDG